MANKKINVELIQPVKLMNSYLDYAVELDEMIKPLLKKCFKQD